MSRTTRDEKARLQLLAASGKAQAQNFLRQAKPSGREGLRILIDAEDWKAIDKAARQEQQQRIDAKVQAEQEIAVATGEEGRDDVHEDLDAASLKDGEMSESDQDGQETTDAVGGRKRRLSSVTLSSGGEDEEPRKAVKPYTPRQRSSTSSPRKLPWLNGPSPRKQTSPKPLRQEHKVKTVAKPGSRKKASVPSGTVNNPATQKHSKEHAIEISDDEDEGGIATGVDHQIRKLAQKKRELSRSVQAIVREIYLLKKERASML
ncbi:hypothetical protein LTR37_017099 [Vermiconidia calcicola]|uniref:Uncharacterized protein n=1 Tax=Vermiconidia calcicola TaxID=1690605 RepID=A0ACC3MLZ7_9PEZI|nr:hypothetical protein LTR37_017099 [Vermiconidia calcicola]